jgi:F0F1-type ATP synthase assembly protein I
MQKNIQQDQLSLAQQHQLSKKQVLRYVVSQLILTAALTIIALLFNGTKAYSALTGGLIATIASTWFAYKVFRVSPDSDAHTMLASAYMGEIYKIVLTGAMFLCAFVLIKPISAWVLLISYFLVHMTPALVSALEDNTNFGK